MKFTKVTPKRGFLVTTMKVMCGPHEEKVRTHVTSFPIVVDANPQNYCRKQGDREHVEDKRRPKIEAYRCKLQKPQRTQH